MIRRLTTDFIGALTTQKWAKLTKCSHDTAMRDIKDLIGKGILKRSEAGGRSTSYQLILPIGHSASAEGLPDEVVMPISKKSFKGHEAAFEDLGD